MQFSLLCSLLADYFSLMARDKKGRFGGNRAALERAAARRKTFLRTLAVRGSDSRRLCTVSAAVDCASTAPLPSSPSSSIEKVLPGRRIVELPLLKGSCNLGNAVFEKQRICGSELKRKGCGGTAVCCKGVTFHSLPSNPASRKVWLVKIRRENILLNANTRVCSVHFEGTIDV